MACTGCSSKSGIQKQQVIYLTPLEFEWFEKLSSFRIPQKPAVVLAQVLAENLPTHPSQIQTKDELRGQLVAFDLPTFDEFLAWIDGITFDIILIGAGAVALLISGIIPEGTRGIVTLGGIGAIGIGIIDAVTQLLPFLEPGEQL